MGVTPVSSRSGWVWLIGGPAKGREKQALVFCLKKHICSPLRPALSSFSAFHKKLACTFCVKSSHLWILIIQISCRPFQLYRLTLCNFWTGGQWYSPQFKISDSNTTPVESEMAYTRMSGNVSSTPSVPWKTSLPCTGAICSRMRISALCAHVDHREMQEIIQVFIGRRMKKYRVTYLQWKWTTATFINTDRSQTIILEWKNA